MNTFRFQVILEQDEDGMYVAEVPSLRACYTQGKTMDEALENIKEVIVMCLEELREKGMNVTAYIPPVLAVREVEVAV